MKYHIVHDYLQVNGGAEKLVNILAKNIPNSQLSVSGIYSPYAKPSLSEHNPIILKPKLNFLSRIPKALYTFLSSNDFKYKQCVIYSGIYAPLLAKKQKQGIKIYYCHTPPKFAFDQIAEYCNRYPLRKRLILRCIILCYRHLYISALERMDKIIVNSKNIQNQLRQLGFHSKVIYPPIDTDIFSWEEPSDYYLSLGRLEPNKRIELIIKAFMGMPDKKLIVTSGGSLYNSLKLLAKDKTNIIFTDWVSERELSKLINKAIACIYIPKNEDFGMSAVEGMAAGKPVIGVNSGGLTESIIHKHTGLLLNKNPTIKEIQAATHYLNLTRSKKMRIACEKQASRFTVRQFIEEITEETHNL